jgi:hypothetical protein
MPKLNVVASPDSEGVFSVAEPLSFLLKLHRYDAFSLRFVKSILAASLKEITAVPVNITLPSQSDAPSVL